MQAHDTVNSICKAIFTTRQQSSGRVMFSLVSVCHSVQCLCVWGGPHVTITHDALDITVQPPPLVLTSSGGHRNTYSWQVGC